MTVADRIKDKRMELNMTQKEMSEKIGTKDRSSISKIESRGNDISMKDIIRIAEALGVTPKYLLGWEDDFGEAEQTSQETCSLSEQEQRDAFELYQRYKRAIPEIQEAVEHLLTSSRSHTP